jgi:hypothetical protein
MNMRNVFTAVACFSFCFFVQFVSGLGGWGWAIAGGALTAILFLLLLVFFELNFRLPWLQYVLPVAASVAATLLSFATGGISDPLQWWAPAAAAAVTCSWLVYQTQNRRRCSLCNRRLGSSTLAFECPRCTLLVCADVCWDSDHLRCRLCVQNHVAILPAEPRWWDRQLGARVNQGRCQICMATPDQSDLRCCGHCGRPQCRDCWDQANGQCSRCHWIIPDLPEKLRAYILTPADSRVRAGN